MQPATPEAIFIFWAALAMVIFVLAIGVLKLMWKIRKFRKEWQITDPKYHGIPVDVGCEHDQPRRRKEPHF